jgi:phytoene/squalene synthetase
VTSRTGAIETPSGKAASGENFPVGSWLIRKDLRRHVHTFYLFARAADDIADNPALAAAECVGRSHGETAVHPATTRRVRRHAREPRRNRRHRAALPRRPRASGLTRPSRYRDWDD